MKNFVTSLILVLISSLTIAEHASGSSNSEFQERFGPTSSEAAPELLQSYKNVFCEVAASKFAKAYGQVIFSTFSCLEGRAEIRIKDGRQTFLIQNVNTYYGDRQMTLISDLAPKADGISYFENLRQLGLDGE